MKSPFLRPQFHWVAALFLAVVCAHADKADFDPGAIIDTNLAAHRASWDGRLVFEPVPTGRHWVGGSGYANSVRVFRPEAAARNSDGTLDFSSAFSGRKFLDKDANSEGFHNTATGIDKRLHIDVVPDPTYSGTDNPYKSDADGNFTPNGPFETYRCLFYQAAQITDTFNVYTNDAWPDTALFHARYTGYVVVKNPRTASASIEKAEPTSRAVPIYPTGDDQPINGFELSASLDGRLILWNGSPFYSLEAFQKTRNGTIVYSFNQDPMATTGWSKPRSISELYYHLGAGTPLEPMVDGLKFSDRYPIAQQPLRSPDGTVFGPGEYFPGGYPWLSFDATDFTASTVPLFKGGRRAGVIIAGKLTNWVVMHPDGPLNLCRGNVTDRVDHFPSRAVGEALLDAYNSKYSKQDWERIMLAPLGLTNSMWMPHVRGGGASDVYPHFRNRMFNIPILHSSGLMSELPVGYATDGGYLFRWSMNELLDYDRTALNKSVNKLVSGTAWWHQIYLSAQHNPRKTGDLSGNVRNGVFVDGTGKAELTFERRDAVAAWQNDGVLNDQKEGVFGDSLFCTPEGRVVGQGFPAAGFQPAVDRGEFTVEFWVKINSLDESRTSTDIATMNGRYWITIMEDRTVQAVFKGRDTSGNDAWFTALSTTPLTDGSWYHIAFRMKDQRLLLNIDGDLEADIAGNMDNLTLADFSTAEGEIAEMRFGLLDWGTSVGELQIDEVSVSLFGRSDSEIMDFAFRDPVVSTDSSVPVPSDLSGLTVFTPAGSSFTAAKEALGERIFFDERLSRDMTVSCATCHDPTFAFAAPFPTSLGVDGRTELNTPTVANLAFSNIFTWHGEFSSLEEQSENPVTSAIEMDMTFAEYLTRIAGDSAYQPLFTAAYGATPRTAKQLKEALSAYSRGVMSHDSPFDRDQLTDEERLGKSLFFGRARCSSCHSGSNFTDNTLRNNGLDPTVTGNEGRMALTGVPQHRGQFKVPTLREISETAPYFHDGRFDTLEAVVEFYNDGGDMEQGDNTDPMIQPLGLSDTEVDAVVAYLGTLDGDGLDRSKPFDYMGTPVILNLRAATVAGEDMLEVLGSNLHPATHFVLIRATDGAVLEVAANNSVFGPVAQGGREYLEGARVTFANRYSYKALLDGNARVYAVNRNVLPVAGSYVGTLLEAPIVLNPEDLGFDRTHWDSDGNGILDNWEIQNGGLGINLSVDSDGDGSSNLEEYYAGTSAIDPNSYLKAKITDIAGGGVNFEWESVPGVIYQIYTSTDFQQWVPHGGATRAFTSNASYYFAPQVLPSQKPTFFRVVVLERLANHLDEVDLWNLGL